MNKKSIQKRIINIVDAVLNPKNPINESTNLRKDLNMTVSQKIELAQCCEYEFDLKLSFSEINDLTAGTVKDMIDFISDFIEPFDK